MLSVKIEICPLDCYSSNLCFSPTTIVLHNRIYMSKLFPSNRQKLKKKRKYNLHEISFASPQAYRCLANGAIRFVTQSQ